MSSKDRGHLSEDELFLGVDFGGSNAKMVALRGDGEQVASRHAPTPDDPHDPKGNLQRRVTALREFHAYVADTHGSVEGIGVSSPGLAARDNRYTYDLPGKMWGVEGTDWQEALDLGVTVRVINDAHAALMAEHWLGAAIGMENVVLLTLGTGVGGALLVNGRLIQGHHGRAGHFGHIIMDPRGPSDIFDVPGSLEWLVGNATVPARTNYRWRDIESLVRDYEAGDRLASRHWLTMTDTLAAGIVSIINSVDPEAVVLSGGVTAAGETLFQPLREAVARYEWQPQGITVPVIPARFGDIAGAIGAAKFIRDYDAPHP